jgi:hypothetical protein
MAQIQLSLGDKDDTIRRLRRETSLLKQKVQDMTVAQIFMKPSGQESGAPDPVSESSKASSSQSSTQLEPVLFLFSMFNCKGNVANTHHHNRDAASTNDCLCAASFSITIQEENVDLRKKLSTLQRRQCSKCEV